MKFISLGMGIALLYFHNFHAYSKRKATVRKTQSSVLLTCSALGKSFWQDVGYIDMRMRSKSTWEYKVRKLSMCVTIWRKRDFVVCSVEKKQERIRRMFIEFVTSKSTSQHFNHPLKDGVNRNGCDSLFNQQSGETTIDGSRNLLISISHANAFR